MVRYTRLVDSPSRQTGWPRLLTKNLLWKMQMPKFSPVTRVSVPEVRAELTPRKTNFDIDDGILYQYKDFHAMYAEEHGRTWPWKARTTQLAAYDTGFAMLKDHASVFTMGDPRYPDCLGRDITDSR